MRTVYLIGNGFDVNLRLKTKYEDFYRWLPMTSKDDIGIISSFLKEVKDFPKNWSDLELELGKFSLKIENQKDAESLHDYIVQQLSIYMSEIEESWSVEEAENNKLLEYILNPISNERLLFAENEAIENYQARWNSTNPWITNIITFNYTQSLERIMGNKNQNISSITIRGNEALLETIEHIHGFSKERMILGVNDVSQLMNEKLHAFSTVTDRYIKKDCIDTYGVDVERKSMKKINEADLICIFGMSYGATDKKWWEAVAKKLTGGAKVILYQYDEKAKFNPNQGPQSKAHKEEVKQQFLLSAGIDQNSTSELKKNIYVALNSDMFKLSIQMNK